MKKCKEHLINPKTLKCKACGVVLSPLKSKIKRYNVSLSENVVNDAKTIIKKYKKVNKSSKINFSKVISNDLEKLTLDKLMNENI